MNLRVADEDKLSWQASASGGRRGPQRDHDALRSEYGGSRVVEMALRSAQDEQALKRIRDELNRMFPPEAVTVAA